MEVLLTLGLILLVIMLVGHYLWLGVAYVLRGFKGSTSAKRQLLCPRCGSMNAAFPCMRCGYAAAATDEHAVTRAVLQELAASGHLDAETHQKVLSAMAASAVPVARLAPPLRQSPPRERPVGAGARVLTPPRPPSQARGDEEGDWEEVPMANSAPPAAQVPPIAPPVPPPQVRAPEPRPPRKPFSAILKAFLEEKNIRWGELIGGLLIVGCSLALVLSLWAQISERPFLKVGVFTAIVAGLFGFGLYAQRKWKLPTTSRGILTTAMLMVPLHFAAMVVIGRQGETDPIALLVQAASAFALAFLVYLAAEVIAPAARWLLTSGLVVLSLTGPVLYASGQIRAAGRGTSLLWAIVMAGLAVAFSGAAVRVIASIKLPDGKAARESLVMMGVLLFAIVPSLAIHAFNGGEAAGYWQRIAPVFGTLLMPALVCTTLLRMRVIEREWTAGLWTAETVLLALLFVAVGIALPMPGATLAAAMLGAAVMLGSGYLLRQQHQLAAGAVLVVVGWAVAAAMVFGRMAAGDLNADLVTAIFVPRFGLEVSPAVLVLGVLGALMVKRDRVGGALVAGVGALAGVLGLLHLAANVYAYERPVPAAWVLFAIYGAAAVAGALLAQTRIAAAIGTGLLLLAGERLLGGGSWAFMVSASSLASAWSLAAVALKQAGKVQWLDLARDSVLGASALVLTLVLWRVQDQSLQASALCAGWAAGACLLLAYAKPRGIEWMSLQVALSMAAILQGMALTWSEGKSAMLLGACAAVIVLRGLWCGLRLAVRRPLTAAVDMMPDDWPLDRLFAAGASLVVACVALLALQGAARLELERATLITDLTHVLNATALWFALAMIVVVGMVEMVGSRSASFSAGLVVLGTFLLGWSAGVKVWPEMGASAIRFASMGLMLAISAGAWAAGSRLRWPVLSTQDRQQLRTAVLLLGSVPIVLLTLFAAGADLAGTGPRAPLAGSLFARLGPALSYLLPLIAVVLVLTVEAMRTRSRVLATCACLTVHLAATLAYVLEAGADEPLDVLRLVQVNAIVAGACAWVWLLLRPMVTTDPQAPQTVKVLSLVCAVAALGTAVWIQWVVFGFPRGAAFAGQALGGWIGWIIAGLAISLWWRLWRERMPAFGVFATVVLVFSLAAVTLPVPAIDRLLPLHVLLLGHVAGVWLMYFGVASLAGLLGRGIYSHGAAHACDEQRDAQGRVQLAYALQASDEQAGVAAEHRARLMSRARVWGIVLAVAGAFFALAALVHNDPHAPWWSVGAFAAIGALGIVVAQRELRPGYLYPATICACAAATCLFSYHGIRDEQALLPMNIAVIAAMGIVSVILEVQRFEPVLGAGRMRLHHIASWLCVAVLLPLSVWTSADFRYTWNTSLELMLATLAAAGTTVALAVACLWVRSMRSSTVLLYLASFVGLAMALDVGDLRGNQLLQVWLICGVGLCVLWGALLRRWDELDAWVRRWGAQLPLPAVLPQANVALAILCMAAMLIHEASMTVETGFAPMDAWLIVVFAAILALLVVALISTALAKITDPLLLPFRERETYVYAAQIAAALLFVHIRLTCPQLFGGIYIQYWPLVMIAIAFAALGAGQLLARRGLDVLSGPIINGALVLALVPGLLAEAQPSRLSYELVLLTVCVFYGVTAATRGSLVAAVLAILAGNGAVWAFLWDRPALSFATHPQLWLVPPALCVIAASYFARGKFTATQLTGMRYGALLVIYLASTMDMFLTGVANAPWLIGVLGLLSVIGALAGIMLRIRSFLYLGTAFLVVSIVTLIYHASANLHQTWLMWLAGIALGIGIILLFAAFEKQRDKIQKLITELQAWES